MESQGSKLTFSTTLDRLIIIIVVACQASYNTCLNRYISLGKSQLAQNKVAGCIFQLFNLKNVCDY